MRVAVVTESFLPTVNGVTTSVCHVLDHLAANGDEAIVAAPAAGSPKRYAGFEVHEMPAFAYRRFPVALPHPRLSQLLTRFAPDVIHVAAPFLLGAQAIATANRLGVPSVAVYQTDIAGYARSNKLPAAEGLAKRMLGWVHEGADLTLAPSDAALEDVRAAGITRAKKWSRGVDRDRYHPRRRTSRGAVELRERLTPNGETLVGYVGRLAPEKSVETLAELAGLPGVRFVVVGDGPSMPSVRRALAGMPVAFLGALDGERLADAYAALDVFTHTGTQETFGQTIQEAQASGVPVVAPGIGGPLDLIDDGVDGMLYSPGDGSLRAAVERLAAERSLRARVGEAGRRRVLDRGWDRVCSELVTHYSSTIRSRSLRSTTV